MISYEAPSPAVVGFMDIGTNSIRLMVVRINSNHSFAVIQQLKERGVVTRGALGVEVQPVTPDIAHALGLKKVEGALVAEAPPGGAAADAGIVPGDVVLAVDGRSVASGADLAAKIGSMAPGTAAKITILRDGSERTLSVRLGELPVTPFKAAAEPQQQKPSALGLTLAPVANSQGVTITDVDPDGLGAEKGLAAGDNFASNSAMEKPESVRGSSRSGVTRKSNWLTVWRFVVCHAATIPS